MRLTKHLSLAALLFLTVILFVYNPPNSFSCQPFMHVFSRWPRMESVKQRIDDSIHNSISVLKLNVSSQEQHQQCPQYTKVSQQAQVSIGQQCSFCNMHVNNQVSDLMYFHVLLRVEPSQEKLGEFQAKLREHLEVDIRINWQVLDMSILPQHLKDKIDNELYTNMIAHQLASMRQSRHCRYTHKNCQSYTILTNQWESLQEGYKQVDKIVFTRSSLIKQTILSLLGAQCLTASTLKRVIKINRLLHLKQQVEKMYKMMDNELVQPNIEFLERKAEQIQSYAQGSILNIDTLILDNVESANIDLFPSEYKIGVYLPLALIMIIFPCFNLLKI